MVFRNAYLLTCDINSPRALFSKNVLETIGFNVIVITCIPDNDKVLSNKISMQNIYELIINSGDDYSYVFEDDINVLEPIKLEEIVEYENISEMFFYLGICELVRISILTNFKINNHDVYAKSGMVRGLHAIGLSKEGAKKLLEFSKQSDLLYMDMILEQFSIQYPANCVRYDLESYISGHKGIIFQDRNLFPSEIS
jgi:hypothetical protein